MKRVVDRNPGQEEFHQAVREVAHSVQSFVEDHPKYKGRRILERLTEPDRIVTFRVCWEDDEGQMQMNRGYRVQQTNAIGPYKGGLRFSPTVSLSVFKFLAFEQVFKNSLTTLPMGGAKGGADFDPKGKSDAEVRRFCKAFMTELSRHIGARVDVPAGDIGVGHREIGYLFGQYKRLRNEFTGSLTGKELAYGGSPLRTEATGYGAVYFAQEMLQRHNQDLEGRRCAVSGAGNAALFTAEKLLEQGAHVITLSDTSGCIHQPEGITASELDAIKQIKLVERGRLSTYAEQHDCTYEEGAKPWGVPCDLAFPAATQNELEGRDARRLIENGCEAVCEVANMPSTPEAIDRFQEADLLYAPGKAANAGGVAVSGMEMTQNAQGFTWSRDEVDRRLRDLMGRIHEQCVEYGEKEGRVDYVRGANIAGFRRVADALLAYGV